MICRICNSGTETLFKALLLNKYEVQYYKCNRCGYLYTEEPYWLEESYKSAINIYDTGILERNLYYSKVVSVLIYFLFNKDGKFVDYAGGYGIFTRLMRDIGFDFYWYDPYSQNLLARGFEYKKSLNKEFELITAFEVFEHLVNPLDEIEKMFDISENIIFSTILLPNPTPKPKNWWYYGFEHGQHISFFSDDTLKFIAKKLGLFFYSYKDVHLLTKRKINNFLFKRLILFSKIGLFSYIKRNLTSKTWEDHLLLKKSDLHK